MRASPPRVVRHAAGGAGLLKHAWCWPTHMSWLQEKYRKKKTKKYVTNVTLRQPTALTICQVC